MQFNPAQKFEVVVSDNYKLTGHILFHHTPQQVIVGVYEFLYREIIQDKESLYHTPNPVWVFRPYNLLGVILNPRVIIPRNTPIISDDLPYMVDISRNDGNWQKYITVPHKKFNLSNLKSIV